MCYQKKKIEIIEIFNFAAISFDLCLKKNVSLVIVLSTNIMNKWTIKIKIKIAAVDDVVAVAAVVSIEF